MRSASENSRRARFETTFHRIFRTGLAVRRETGSRVLRAALLALVALGCGAAEERASDAGAGSSGPPPATVEVVRVAPEELRRTAALTGQLEAEYSVVVRPETPGVIRSFEATEGERAAKGDVLYRLRDEEQRAKLLVAEAEYRLARDVFDRTQSLTSRAISAVSKRAEAAAGLDEAKAMVQLAQLDLARTRIRAPFDGLVGMRLKAPGDRVQVEDGLIRIDAVDRLQLVFTVPETGAALARAGATIYVRVIAWRGERFPGEVFFISPTIDSATRRLLMKAWVPNEDHRLKPGMFANVDVEIARQLDALLVPESAIVYDRNGTYAWRVGAEDKAEKIPVELGARQQGRVQVVAGINAGDLVISAGTNKVIAGKVVKAKHAPAGSGSSGPGGSGPAIAAKPTAASPAEADGEGES